MNIKRGKSQALVVAVFWGTLLLCGISFQLDAHAAEDSSGNETGKQVPNGFRGSTFIYRNVASAISLTESTEPTYNPYYAMEFSFLPRVWANQVFYVGLGVFLSREFTESDWTTRARETVLGDVRVTAGFVNFYHVPILKVDMSATVGIVAPTSRTSRSRTLVIGLRPGLSLTRKFRLLEGLSIGYQLGLSINSFSSTTGLWEEPTIACAPGLQGCGGIEEITQSTGVRNSPFGLSNELRVSLGIWKFLSVSAAMGLSHSFLYKTAPMPQAYENSWEPISDTNVRYGLFSGVEITVTPVDAWSIAIGAETSTAQLEPDADYQVPFFNRYTNVYLDLRLHMAALVSAITSGGE